MSLSKDTLVRRATADLARRLKTTETEIAAETVEQAEFADMSLGAPLRNEMSAQMIASGYRIRLNAKGKIYEYRADAAGDQLRLVNFNGANHIV